MLDAQSEYAYSRFMHSTAFGRWIDAQPEPATQVAKRLGLTQTMISRYRRGVHVPRPAQMARLMTLTGLPVEAFIPGLPTKPRRKAA